MPTSLTARLRRPAVFLLTAAVFLVGLAPAVGAAGGVEVTTPYPSIAVAPGSSASFDLTITSSAAETVSLVVLGTPTGWKATIHGGGFVIQGVSAAPGKPGTARLDVQVPGDTTATNGNLRVEAKSGSGSAVLPITVLVNADVAGDITFTTTSPTLTGASDTTFNFPLTLQNGTAQDQTVSASAKGPAGWTVDAKLSEANAASTIVKAGSSTTITVTATPPVNAPAGHTDIDVVATVGTKTIPGKLGIDITGTFKLTLSTPGDLLSAHGSAGSAMRQALEVRNGGTGDLTGVTVTATPPSGWTVTFDPADGKVDVPTGTKAGTVTAIITPSGDAVAGDYVVTFNASNDDARSTQDIRFTVETSPIWALVGIGVIGLILAGLFYVFRTYGRR
ncbi:MAG TPA: NEW3 domain-containing protein [Candidatus Limnocylindrales bacterium]|nr:NEW3 domain-containing protein [Candidatus Limnocylindrales bacterium]